MHYFLKIGVSTLVLGGIIAALFTALTPENDQNFQLVCQTKILSSETPVFKFKSLRTGLHVITVKIEGPTIQGRFTLATEPHDDDGLPHTLEHLVFLGSEDYPYKGVLDLLANRCFADGTNAQTAKAHTSYNFKTAGKDGFLNLLPIFLEHILYPTLTDAAFLTEIYHITGKGEDAGVAYSEMQANENTGMELIFNEMLKALYPYPSGYRYEPGGKLANLRNNISNEKIRQYHKSVYRPENLYLIITGDVNPVEIFEALTSIEDKIVSKGDRGPFVKPWQTPVPPLTNSVTKTVAYPSDTEDNGIIFVGWRGPSFVNNITEFQSMNVVLEYLIESSVSPLPKSFVEIADPFAGYVDGSMLQYASSAIYLNFERVPLNKVDRVYPLLMDIFNKIVSGEIPFYEKAMKNTLNNLILNEESMLETSPHTTISNYIVTDVLYGKQCQDISKIINEKESYEKLLSKPPSYWISLIKKYFIDVPSVVIKGVPSTDEAFRMHEEERKRVEKRREELGEEGLKQLEDKLNQAKKINEIPPPESMLESVPVPSTANIKFRPLKAYTNIEKHSSGFIPKSDPSLFDFEDVSVKMMLNDVKSNFVQLVAILDTQSLSPTDRLYLPILMELLLESPMQNGSTVIPYEEVVENLNEDTIDAENMIGLEISPSGLLYGPYFHYVMINLKMEMKKYEKGVRWMSDILFNVIFDPDRITLKANKLLSMIGGMKEQAHILLYLLVNEVTFKEDTNIKKGSILRQEKFLRKLLETLQTNPKEILNDLQRIYKSITKLEDITVLMATNLQKLSTLTDASKPWQEFANDGNKSQNMILRVVSDAEESVDFSRDPSVTGYVVGKESWESGFIIQMTNGIPNYSDEDLPALLTAVAYFSQQEGPIHKEIRGKGFAYDYGIKMDVSRGILFLILARVNQISEAYEEVLKLFNSHLNGSEPWNHLLFDSAKSSLVYKIVQTEEDISDVIQHVLYAYYRKVPLDYNKSFLRAIDKVTLDDVIKAFKKYFKPLIDPTSSKTLIACPLSKARQIKDDLEEHGHSMEIVESIEDSKYSNI